MARMSGRDSPGFIGAVALVMGLVSLDHDEVVRDMLKDYEIKEECGFYESVERKKSKGRQGRPKHILTFIYNNKKTNYFFLNTPLLVALQSANAPLGSTICITSYQRNYSLTSSYISLFKVSVDAEVIYYDESQSRPSHKTSYILIGLGLAILVVYWLFIRRK